MDSHEHRSKEIIGKILKLMHHIEQFSNYTGQQKREYVMRNMKEYLGDAQYIQAKLFLLIIIDVVIGFSKGMTVDINKDKVSRCCCWLLV